MQIAYSFLYKAGKTWYLEIVMEEVIPLHLRDGVFSIELAILVQYTKYNKPYALRQQTCVRCIVASDCVSFDKQAAVSQ